ncbi:hypothetical protein ABIF25_000918 [Bradyrhizobium elkanii]
MAPHARASHPPFDHRSCGDDRYADGSHSKTNARARSFAGRGAAISGDRPHRIPDRRRPVRNSGNSTNSGAALRRNAWCDGFRRQRQHDRHGGRRTGGRILQPAHRSQDGHSGKPTSARDSDELACRRAEPYRLHDSSHHAGPLHGFSLYAHPCLSGRTVQRDGCRRRLRGLYHRERRKQSYRTSHLGVCVPQSGPGDEFLFLCPAQSRRRAAGPTSRSSGSSPCTPLAQHNRHFRQ